MIHPNLNIRLPPELRAALQAIADRQERSLTYIIRKALEEWLAQQKGRTPKG